jgi:hypothetical protein
LITVASFYCKREEEFPDAVDYIPLLRLLQASCDRFGHRHVVISDAPVEGFETFVSPLPSDLMLAIMYGQRDWIARGDWKDEMVMVGADCLVGRDLRQAFTPGWDVCVTNRPHRKWPINTGAIYVKGGARLKLASMWARAAAAVNGEWGDDQVQVAMQFAPVPTTHLPAVRQDLTVQFSPMSTHNHSPKRLDDASSAFVIHFKGPRKSFMADWAKRHMDIAA